MRRPMRILLLTPRLPWPPLDGGRVAMSRLAVSLAKSGAEVELLSLNPRKHRAEAAASPLPAVAVDVDTSRILTPAYHAIASGTPFLVSRFVSLEYQEALRAALQRFQPDLVQFESPFLLPYLETVRRASRVRTVLRSLNVEFRIWEELARNERNPLRRLALQRVARSLRTYEVQTLDRVDAIVPISEEDGADFRALGARRPMHVVPCGVTLPEWAPGQGEQGTVGFIGSLDFRPNQGAVQWIVEELWPRVLERMPEARLALAGSAPPGWLLERARSRGVTIQGNVADAQAFVRGLSVFIAPLFAGGGMRIKVLEAMALGKPVVATTRGAGGIEATPERELLIADDAPSFAAAVVRLLRDEALARRMGEAARAMVAARYDSDLLAAGLVRFYQTL
jgi:glycosyltransferase involved in cell wall biosynthesis